MFTNTAPVPTGSGRVPEVIVFGHSRLFYWWPVWVAGYLMALVTWLHPVQVRLGNTGVLFSAQTSLGVIYAVAVLLAILITHTSMRGLVSLVVVLCVAFLVLLFAYLDW
jgi:hypothetical protein